MKREFFNFRKSKLLLLTLLTMLVVGASPAWADELTVNDGTGTSNYVPIYGYYVDTQNTTSEFIIPADRLEDLEGGTISQMTFYLSTPVSGSWEDVVFEVYLKEVTATTYASATANTEGTNTVVYSGSLDGSQSTMVVPFSSNYVYGGGNLLVGFKVTTAGYYANTYFYGEKFSYGTYPAYYNNGASYNGRENFLPKVTFEYTAGVGVMKKPKDVTASNILMNSATISWTAGGSETSWEVSYSTSADEPAAEGSYTTVNTNSCELTGLTAGTTYYVYVRSVDGDNKSKWSSVVLTTKVAPVTAFPWTENFNSLVSGIPANWDNSEGTTTTDSYKWNYYATGHDGAGLRFNSYNNSSNNTNMLKTPAMNFPSGKVMQLTFWYKNPTGGDFSVYVSGDGGSTYTTALATGLTGQSSWKQMELVIPSDFTENVVIVFKGTSNYGNGDAYIYLDDVVVEETPTVLKPTDLAVSNVTYEGATLSWTAGGDETAWKVIYGATGFDPETEGTTVDVTENPYTLTGLQPETAYDVYVKAVKGSDVSKASDKASFTTTERYPAPADLAISNLTTSSATLTWTAGEATAWEVAVNTTGETPTEAGTVVNAATYEFTELTAETTYYAFVRTKDGDNYSAWSAACEFLPSANTYLTVNDGTTTNSYVPVYGYFSESTNLGGQFIIPAASLTDVQNKVIKKLTFYSATTEYAYGDAEFDVCIKEVSDATMSSSMYAWDESWTKVYSGTIAVVAGKMNITFTSDFNYTGSNLLVGIHKTSTDKSGSNYNVTFYGNNSSNYMSNYAPNGNRQKFQPKTTIGYQEKTGSELKVFDGETELAVSPASFDFGLAEAGTTHTFTLKNTAATPYVATISSTNLTVSPTEVTPTAEGVSFTVTMPAQSITNEAVVITPANESGLEPFTINVSGTIKEAGKFEEDFSGNALPNGWTKTDYSSDYKWTFTNGYANVGYQECSLTTPTLAFTAGEKFFFDACNNYSWGTSGYVKIQTSVDGENFVDLQTFSAEADLVYNTWKTYSVTIPSADVKYVRFLAKYSNIDNVYGGEKVSGANFAINTDGSEQNFGKVAANATAEKSFTVSNNGNKPLFVTISNPADFTAKMTPNAADKNVYFTDAQGWGDIHVYYWNNGPEWPGVAMTELYTNDYGQKVYYYELPDDVEGIIFNGNGNQTVDIKDEPIGKAYYTTGEKEGNNYTVGTWSYNNCVPAGESSVLTVTMNTATPGSKSGNVTLSFEALNATSFTIPCTGFVKDPNALEVDFADGNFPENWQVGADWSVTSGSAVNSNTKTPSAIVTTPLTVAENETMTFSVKRNLSGSSSYTKSLKVRYSQDGGVNWSEYKDYGDEFGSSFATYELTGVPAGTVIVEFLGNNIMLDDIEGFTKTTGPVLVLTESGAAVANGATKDFGNITAEATATYTLKNAGNAALVATLAGEGISVSPANVNLAAGETADITVTLAYAEPYGEKTGTMTISSESWVGDMTVNFTADAIDQSGFVVDFTDNALPTGWYNGGWTIAGGVAYVYQGVSKQLITEKIGAEDGKNVLRFDAKAYTGSDSQTLSVYTSADRKTWSEAQTFTLTGETQTFSLTELADGEYYVKFEALNAQVDNIKGVKKLTAPTTDLYLVSTTWPTGAVTPGSDYTATVNVASLVSEEVVAAELYFGESKVAELTEQTIANGATKTFTLTGAAPAAGTYDVYAKVYNDNGTVETDKVSVTVADTRIMAITAFTRTSDATVQADENNEFTATFDVTVQNNGTASLTANEVSVTLTDGTNAYENGTFTWTAENSNVLYMNTSNDTDDIADGCTLKAWCWNTADDGVWTEFTKVSDGFYSLALNGKTNFIVCRVNPDGTDEDPWNNVWNQSGDLSLTNGNLVKFQSWGAEGQPMIFSQESMGKLEPDMSTTLKLTLKLSAGEGGSFTFNAKENVSSTQYYLSQSVTATPYVTLTLSEEETYAQTTEVFGNVTLNRPFYEGWNTVVLPVDIDAVTLAEKFGKDAVLYQFSNYSEGQLTFTKKTDGLVANTPYLLYLTQDVDNLTFTGVTVQPSTSVNMHNVNINTIEFKGNYVAGFDMKGKYGVTPAGKLQPGAEGSTMKAFRAYLTTSNTEARISTIFIEGEATGIGRVLGADEAAQLGIFNLNGQPVSGMAKGVVIVNGKKVVRK